MGESEVTDFDAILFLFFFFLLFYTAYKLEKERPNYFRKVSGEKFKKRAIMSAIVYAFYILYAQYLHYTKGLAGLAEGYWNLLLFSLLLTPLLFLEPKEEFVAKLNKRSRILAIVYGTVIIFLSILSILKLIPKFFYQHILIFDLFSSEMMGALLFIFSYMAFFLGISLLMCGIIGKALRTKYTLSKIILRMIGVPTDDSK